MSLHRWVDSENGVQIPSEGLFNVKKNKITKFSGKWMDLKKDHTVWGNPVPKRQMPRVLPHLWFQNLQMWVCRAEQTQKVGTCKGAISVVGFVRTEGYRSYEIGNRKMERGVIGFLLLFVLLCFYSFYSWGEGELNITQLPDKSQKFNLS